MDRITYLQKKKEKEQKKLQLLRKECEKYDHEYEMVQHNIPQRMHRCFEVIDGINAELAKEGVIRNA